PRHRPREWPRAGARPALRPRFPPRGSRRRPCDNSTTRDGFCSDGRPQINRVSDQRWLSSDEWGLAIPKLMGLSVVNVEKGACVTNAPSEYDGAELYER